MKLAQDIIIKPIITEASMMGVAFKKYTFKVAADANKDGNVDKLDYLAVLRDFYGYAKITQ